MLSVQDQKSPLCRQLQVTKQCITPTHLLLKYSHSLISLRIHSIVLIHFVALPWDMKMHLQGESV